MQRSFKLFMQKSLYKEPSFIFSVRLRIWKFLSGKTETDSLNFMLEFFPDFGRFDHCCVK